MEPCPPMATLASHGHGHGGHVFYCALYRSCTALWIVTTSPEDHKAYTALTACLLNILLF